MGNEWFSLGTLTAWLWRNAFSRRGGSVALVLAAMTGYTISPPQGLADYLALPLIWLFLLFFFGLIFVALATLGDLAADAAIHKLIAVPNPANIWHRSFYFCVSLVGFLLALVVISFTRYPHSR